MSSAGTKRGRFAFLLVVLAACGGREAPVFSDGRIDLLARTPDGAIEEVGTLRPDRRRQWAELGLDGWTARTEWARGDAFVWAHTPVARLDLPAVGPEDREIRLRAWAPEAQPLTVRLNGVELAEVELTSEQADFRVEAPGPAWRSGSNVLELEVPALTRSEDGIAVGFALVGLTYGERRVTTSEPGRVRLPARTGVRYRLEALAPMEVDVEAATQGSGRLEVASRLVDPVSGAVSETVGDVAVLRPEDGRAAGRLAVPDPGGRLLELSVSWTGARGSVAEVRRLGLTETDPVERVSVIFLSIDTLAANHLSVYGYPRATCPNLEQFASEAVLFEECRANATWTLPSYLSVVTGLYPRSHRLDFEHWKAGSVPENWEVWRLARDRWTLAEMMRGAGYRTAGFVDNLWISERVRFLQGFDRFDNSAAYRPDDDPDGGARLVFDQAREWLDELVGDEPFFLFLHAFDVHGPFVPDEPFAGRFHGDEQYDPGLLAPAGGVSGAYGVIPTYVSRGEVPEGELPEQLPVDSIEAAYDEEILMLDHELGVFFEWLRERGLYDRSLLIVTADHGESMAAHDTYFSHGVLYEDVVHVPLLVRMPGGAGGGRSVATPVQLVDLYPTLADFIGLEGRAAALHGRSLLPALEGGALERRPTYSEGGVARQGAVELGGWKLIERWPARESSRYSRLTSPDLPRAWVEEHLPELVDRPLTDALYAAILARPDWREIDRSLSAVLAGPRYELYDLRSDPREERNVHAEHPEKAAELLELLRAEERRTEAARAVANEDSLPAPLSDEDRAALEALGYLGDR